MLGCKLNAVENNASSILDIHFIPPGDPRSVSLNAPYHKEQNIYGLGVGICTVPKISII